MTLDESLQSYRLHLLGILLLVAGLYSSVVPPMVLDWYKDDNYSHGFIVPFVAGYFLYRQRDELRNMDIGPSMLGLPIIILALLQLVIAWLGTEYFTMRSSLVVLIAGIVIALFGLGIFRCVRLSIFYLLFMVPLPYIIYDQIAFPLKLFVTKLSVNALKAVGIAVVREGNIIMFPTTTLEVADACSGIRSLVSLLALTVAYAFFIELSSLKRWCVILAAIPIAVACNAFRVIGTGILAQYWGPKAAEGFFHEFAGLAVFALAIILIAALSGLLKKTGIQDHGRGQKETGAP